AVSPAVHALPAPTMPPAVHALPAATVPPELLQALEQPAAVAVPSSLVEREVPAWRPPSDLRAVGAAAASGRSPRAPAAEPPKEVESPGEPFVPPVAAFEPASIVPDEYLPP